MFVPCNTLTWIEGNIQGQDRQLEEDGNNADAASAAHASATRGSRAPRGNNQAQGLHQPHKSANRGLPCARSPSVQSSAHCAAHKFYFLFATRWHRDPSEAQAAQPRQPHIRAVREGQSQALRLSVAPLV